MHLQVQTVNPTCCFCFCFCVCFCCRRCCCRRCCRCWHQQVTGIDVQPDKKEEVTRLGASEYLLFKDALESRKAHFDLILNSASASLDWAGIVGCLAPNGTLVQLGIPGGNALIQVPLQVRG